MFCFMQAWAAEPNSFPLTHLWAYADGVVFTSRFEQTRSVADLDPLLYHLSQCLI